ncbi:flagellar basal body L-ring protein FlgH [Novosphingobium beihaiensis]|uniref:Flagellar L-ring protein n=1 Tax=Novosphingobium beihaiensis TaxID=2930389 RepID=A0ABT0BPQ0_9SPHN|nr:flagellar basal body L-ring protein FlgH [Novosphingobium beihaiensis]MCJ2186996.1 flagellar basal body L-ring protein FlgH [Novosphingobium beihaiensis]
MSAGRCKGGVALLAAIFVFSTNGAQAEQLYHDERWAAMASDRRASEVGDIITIVIHERANASNRVRNKSDKSSAVGGSISGGALNETGALNFGGSYSGGGEVTRTEEFQTLISAQIMEVLPNGDFMIEGHQNMQINGEKRDIIVRGRIRQADISSDNAVLSSRIADAQINYDGRGFLSRSAKPGLLNKIFSFLGIG